MEFSVFYEGEKWWGEENALSLWSANFERKKGRVLLLEGVQF